MIGFVTSHRRGRTPGRQRWKEGGGRLLSQIIEWDRGLVAFRYLGSISPMFNEQLLPVQIPIVRKDTYDLTVFLRFWDLGAQKLLGNIGEIDPWCGYCICGFGIEKYKCVTSVTPTRTTTTTTAI